jgi:transcriptional regulator with XRE-family HTH domain
MASRRLNEKAFRIALVEKDERQWRIAAQAGFSPSTFNQILKGKRPEPPDLIERLAEVLKVAPDVLMIK